VLDLPTLPGTAHHPHLQGGAPVSEFLSLEAGERVLALTSLETDSPGQALGTRQGVVVYIACEGERGLGARVEAFRIGKLGEEDDPDPPFYLLTTRLDLTGDVERLIEDLQAAGIGKTALIVVDTLNRSIHGSENKDEDMGAYVQAADRLQEVFGGLVLIVHHCGVNSERPRGHSSLTGAVDVQLKDERSVSGQVIVDVEFLKDGNEGERIVSVLTPLRSASRPMAATSPRASSSPARARPSPATASKNART